MRKTETIEAGAPGVPNMEGFVTLYHVDYYTTQRTLAVTGFDPEKTPPFGGAVHCTSERPCAGPVFFLMLHRTEICTLEDIRESEGEGSTASYGPYMLLESGGRGLLDRFARRAVKPPKRARGGAGRLWRENFELEFYGCVSAYMLSLAEWRAVNHGVAPWDFLESSRDEWKRLAESVLCAVAVAMDRGYKALELAPGEYVVLPGSALVRTS